jgi:hypothetical protein
MAVSKSINFLPEIFRSETNQKFLAATVDQLISEPNFHKVSGYIGRKFAPTYLAGDSYITEPSKDRQDYQLEPSIVVQDNEKNVTFYSNYVDLIQKLKYYGGLTDNHSRLFSNESYNFDGLIDFDKFVNFSQYYWLPDGPPAVTVSADTDVSVLDFVVRRDTTSQSYKLTGYGNDTNPTITLVKGNTYTFRVAQNGRPLWIQTHPGPDGTRSVEAEALSRTILGVENNGIDSGLITFRVPGSTAQNDYISATKVADIDFATTLSYAQLQSHLTSEIERAGGIDGVTDSLQNRTVIFITRRDNNDDWKDPGVFDFDRFDSGAPFNESPYEYGETVRGPERYDVFRINAVDVGGGKAVVKLTHILDVNTNEKVYVRAGNSYAGVEFYKNPEGYWEQVQPITATLTDLYYQDATDANFGGRIKLIEPDFAQIDIDRDVIGQINYTSPNGVKFTNGMKVVFDTTVTPQGYQNNFYIVEGVGKGIRLVGAGNLLVPEVYAVNDNLQVPDYITINRSSSDLNAWSRSNRWFHSELITLAAAYNNDPLILAQENTIRASRPIIEFDPDLYLYNYGQVAKAPVDVLDYSVTDAFKEVEGQLRYVIQLPNGNTRELTNGTRIIFAADKNPDVRNRIYRVDFITTSDRTQIHLVSQTTESLPTYIVSGAQIVDDVKVEFIGGNPVVQATGSASIDSITGAIISIDIDNPGLGYRSVPTITLVGSGFGIGANLIAEIESGAVTNTRIVSAGSGYATAPSYTFVPSVEFSDPVPGIGTLRAAGTAIMEPTTVKSIELEFSGLNYIADPFIEIETEYTQQAEIRPVYSEYKYVDYVRLTEKGSGYSAGTKTVTFTNPNLHEAIQLYVSGPTDEGGQPISFTSDILVVDSFPTGIAEGWLVYSQGIIGGTTVQSFDAGTKTITLSNKALLESGRTVIFKSATNRTATVTDTVRFSKRIEIDDTLLCAKNMFVTGGSVPLRIVSILTGIPVLVRTFDNHGLSNGDQVTITGVAGTSELNNNTYFVGAVAPNALTLFSSPDLIEAVDGRGYTIHVPDTGTVTAFTVPHNTFVSKIISPTVIELNQSVSLLTGTKLAFIARRAIGVASADSNEVYTIKITEPGAGYLTVPAVEIETSGVVGAQGIAIPANPTIEYVKVDFPGVGYQLGNNIVTKVIDNQLLTTTTDTLWGTRQITFGSVDAVRYLKPGWIALLVIEDKYDDTTYYGDFARVPYVDIDTTGPNPDTYQAYMDVGLTEATVLRIASISGGTVTLTGDINSLDADGERITLPAGAQIFFTAQDKFFTEEAFADSRPVGNEKSTFIIQQTVFQASSIKLNTVSGIQIGMEVTDLANTLPSGLFVTAIDQYTSTVFLNQEFNTVAGVPLKFSSSAKVRTTLNPAKIKDIGITEPGAEYTSAPVITIQPVVPQVIKSATSTGTDVIEVNNLNGIVVGSTVTSEYDVDGNGITTGSSAPKVIALSTEQIGTNRFRFLVQLSQVQPVFTGVLVSFTYATRAISKIQSLSTNDTVTDDETPDTYEADNTVVVTSPTAGESALTQRVTGVATYTQYWYDGTNWYPAQQKTRYNQSPGFDVFDINGFSAGDTEVYPGSKFEGTPIFAYKVGTGPKDPILGIALSYKSFQNVGDIEFENRFDIDTFQFSQNKAEVTKSVNSMFLRQKTNAGVALRNIWTKATEETKQYQIIAHDFDGVTNYFEIDVLPNDSQTIPYLKVYVNSKFISDSKYQLVKFGGRYAVVVDEDLLSTNPASKVDILVYSNTKSRLGHFQVPSNLDTNTLNTNFKSLTLGQMRNHLVTMSQNHYGLEGEVLGRNNLRDISVKKWTGSILQHASPAIYSALFLGDQGLNFVESIEYAQKEYTKFKNKFLDLSTKVETDFRHIPNAVDAMMNVINVGKNTANPWYDSDMVPYGSANITTTIKINDDRQRRFEIPSIFNDTVISRRSVLVYQVDSTTGLNRQLIKDIDFSFNKNLPAIDLAAHVQLEYTQQLLVVDRPSTVGNYIPETPTKLGLYPKFMPMIFVDDTYQTPTKVIQGHDGSITPAFNDYRDDLLMELELRIYNNIKVDYQNNILNIADYLPGKFRNADYSITEYNKLLTRTFLKWVGSNQVNYSANTTFQSNNAWTWNYRGLKDASNESLIGFWRGIYHYYYDTDRPHTNPWEMLGFSEMPTWWVEYYGPAPYTGGNKYLWDDLEAGLIRSGTRQGIDKRFARPGLSKLIPVDEYGALKSPEKIMVRAFDSTRISSSWAIGDHGPVESAWRRSSDFPYAVQLALAIAKPAFYFGSMFNTDKYYRNDQVDQLLMEDTFQRVTPTTFTIPDDGINSGTTTLTAGYVNWIRDYYASKGIDGTSRVASYLRKFDVKLSYKLAGYTDSSLVTVLADQSSPNSNNSNIIIPPENYKIFLNKSAPVSRIVYSAVIIEKTPSGFSVGGYDLSNPYFTIIPSVSNGNSYFITAVEERAVIYKDYQRSKITVPYGYEFETKQEVVDFLVSYGRYLTGQGMVFDTYSQDLETKQDWILSAKEFLTWSQQGWDSGNILVLSPAFTGVKVINRNGVVDHVQNILSGSKILDQNFTIIKNSQFTVTREGNTFTLKSLFNQTIGLADLNIVQFEHVMLFDNTTVFSDVIYQPELGNRQFRLKLVGNKTGEWTGQLNPAGFIYNKSEVDIWTAGTRYVKGTLVDHKGKYYYASETTEATAEFDFNNWTPVDKNSIKTGLLSNFAQNAEKFNAIYRIDNHSSNKTIDSLSQGIIGYRDRSYFQDFELDPTSQAKFYQGFIKQKGTASAITALTKAQFNNITSQIDVHEEWAFRVGEYGALGSDQYVEFIIDEEQFVNDPTTVILLDRDEPEIDGLVNLNPVSIYRSSEDIYNKNPLLVRTDTTPRVGDNITAGYPRVDDVDGTIFDINTFQDLSNLIKDIGSGYKLWVAKDFNKIWNVYRASETNVLVTELRAGLDANMTVATDIPHKLAVGNLFVIKNFDPDFDGFYQVTQVVDNLTVVTTAYRNTARLRRQQAVDGSGVLFKMESVRYTNVSKIIETTPPNGWKNNDRVWVDNDTGNGEWGVFEKTTGWEFDKLLPLREGDWRTGEQYGSSVKLGTDNNIILAGTPNFSTGSISGVRVLDGGFNYEAPDIIASRPPLDDGQVPGFTINLISGTLVKPTLVNPGSNYTVLPNIAIVDETTQVTTTSVLDSTTLTLANVEYVYQADYIIASNEVDEPISRSNNIQVTAINTSTRVITLSSTVTLQSNTSITFVRGTSGALQAQLVESFVTDVAVVNGGSGFTSTPRIELVGGNGQGATGECVIQDGAITGVNITSPGTGYTEPPVVNVIATTSTTGVVLRARLAPRPLSSLFVTSAGQEYKNPRLVITPGIGDTTGTGAVGNVLVTNKSIDSVTIRGAEFGTGYVSPPNLSVVDSGAGAGAVIESIYVTGSAKSFVRTDRVTTKIEQIQTIRPFGPDAREFGKTVDIGNTFAFVSAPGSYSNRGIVTVLQYQNSAWNYKQVIQPIDINDNDRFGESIAVSRDERWLYVGAPGANKVYVYAKSEIGTGQIQLEVVPGVFSYITGFSDAKNSIELKILGTSGRLYEPNFDYSVSAGIITFVNFDRIKNEPRLFVTRVPQPSLIVPFRDAFGVYARSYTLTQRPDRIEQIVVVGSDGRVFVPYREFIVIGEELVFLNDEFQTQASIQVVPLDPFYILITTLEPSDLVTYTEYGTQFRGTPVTQSYNTFDEMVIANPSIDTVSKIEYRNEDGTFDSYKLFANIASADGVGIVSYEYIEIAEENRKVSRIGKFGSSIATTTDGYQVIVGAPEVTVTGEDGDERRAGKVYVFDRSYQVYTGSASGSRVFVTTNPLTTVTKVTVDDVEVTRGVDYNASGFNVSFVKAPRNGAIIKVDVNKFNLIQAIENPDPVFQGFFGITVSIAPNNQSIFVGAPGYRSVLYYNGRVYRYVNQGLVYGEITSTITSPQTKLSDSIRVNNTEVVLSESAGITARILNDIRNQNIIGITASLEGISSLIFTSRGTGYFESNVGAVVSPPDLPSGIPALIGNITVTTNGAIDSFRIISSGTGYTKLPTVAFTGANTAPAAATVSTTGSKLTLRVSNPASLGQLDVLPGDGTALADIGLSVYALTQVIEHPDRGVPEKFGTNIRVDTTDGETLMVASEGAATLKSVTFDNELTIFDRDTTRFIDTLRDSGAVYIYDYLPIPGETLSQPGKFLYNQVLQNAEIKFNDNFGAAIDINKGIILVGADGSNFYGPRTGLVHMFTNLDEVKGWVRLRSRSDVVDIDYINRVLAYDKDSQVVIAEFDYYDPVKGKILGIADQDIDYKTSYDPAFYNKGANATVTFDESSAWNEVQIGQVWWNLDLARFIDYEQGDINYRIAHWGELFEGSEIEILEWVESTVLPSEYATIVNDGEAKYADNSAYVETAYFDKQSGLIRTKYYYWVKNKLSIDKSKTKRTNSIVSLASIIKAPALQDIPFMAAIAPNSFALYNANNLAEADNTVFRLEYAQVVNDNIAHNEYELVKQNNASSAIPPRILNKLIDSLAGENISGDVVPDLRLKEADRYGIGVRPRQSMIINQAKASKILVDFINNFAKQYLVTRIYNISNLKAAEEIPQAGTGFYNQAVNTIEERDYILASDRYNGFRVLVKQDASNDGFWTIYIYENNDWRLERIQSFDSTRYWDFVNWYAPGYSDQTQVQYIINRYTDFGSIAFRLIVGDVVRVLDDGSNNFELYVIDNSLTPQLVGVGNGTIELNSKLYDTEEALVGMDTTGFDSIGFAKTASIEVRNILRAVINDLFSADSPIETNKLFFTMLNYIMTEQKNVDWALKTSFISVAHKIRKLLQFPNYIQDQQDYYEEYINEVKPYRTQVRDYLLNYTGDDIADVGSTDFDFPSYYDRATGRNRTLDIDNNRDLAIVKAGVWNDWLNNYKYSLQSIRVSEGGTGYTSVPTITITGGGGTGATGVARILSGRVISVQLLNPGSGYTSQPNITFVGGNGIGAVAYAELRQLEGNTTLSTLNKTVRSVKTTLNFDRIAYSSSVVRWQPYTTYHPGDIVVVDDVKTFIFTNLQDQALPRYSTPYLVLKTLLGSATIDLNQFNDETIVQKLSGSDISNATDRLAIYNKPGTPDSAILFGSPDTERLDPATTNNEATSTGNKWNKVAHSILVPATHEYQYLSIGDRGLLGISADGVNWENISLNDASLKMRDGTFANGTTWVAVGNSGSVLLSDNAFTWERTQINNYRYSPAPDAPGGFVLDNAAQAIDLTSVTYADTTNGQYVLAVGNGSTILVNPFESVPGLSYNWYSVKVQPLVYQLPVQYLTAHAESYGSLSTLAGDKYLVNIQLSGNFVQRNLYKGTWNPNTNIPNLSTAAAIADIGWVYEVSASGAFDFGTGSLTDVTKGEFIVYNGVTWTKSLESVGNQLRIGYVVVAGVNGGVFITSYARLDDIVQGYARNYNYDLGKGTNLEYPWIQLAVPTSVAGVGDGVSGEQVNAVALSDAETHWIVAVGSAGTLLWNTVDSPVEVQDGSSDIGADTIGETVVSHGIEVFKNFREFNAADFVTPLTKSALESINLTGITWDGEKFVVVGDRSTVIWGYPGNQSEAYIDIGNINPNGSAGSRRPSASWVGGTDLTELSVTILTEDFAGTIVNGMTLVSPGLPTSGIVVGSSVNLNTNAITINIVFETPQTIATSSDEAIGLAYQITKDIPNGTILTFVGPGGVVKELEVSRDVEAGDTRIYVNNYADVNANWTASGLGMPIGAMVRAVGKFAKFTWQYARGSGRDINVNYYSVDVNKTTIRTNIPVVKDLEAGTVVTFFDPTGLKIQKILTQNIVSGTNTLAFESNDELGIGFKLEPSDALGIAVDTEVVSTKTYSIGGVLGFLHRDIPDNIPGTSYPGVFVTGQGYTETATDLLSLDTTIRSDYTDNELGVRPEDIIVDGGKYIDTYSSHAPEELVPGQVIDSLQMTVFTANVVNGTPDYSNVIAYRIFTDYKLPTVYYRLPENATTTLSEDLAYNATEIVVDDISKIIDPNPALNQPGSIWIGAEKINYFGIDRVRGVLTDLRRGANRTSIPLAHVAGSIITDASSQQEVDRDTVFELITDIEVNNGFGGAANTVVYQSAVTSTITQGRIWQA